MEYNFSFVLRSDDYYPVYQRVGHVQEAIQEILLLDNSATFSGITSDITEEGTGNLCTFTATVQADSLPSRWLIAAETYTALRDLDFVVSLVEVKELEVEPEVVPEVLPEAKPEAKQGVSLEVEPEIEPEVEPEVELP
jgi:hypothetical protein